MEKLEKKESFSDLSEDQLFWYERKYSVIMRGPENTAMVYDINKDDNHLIPVYIARY